MASAMPSEPPCGIMAPRWWWPVPGFGPSAAGESPYPVTSSLYVNVLGTVSPSLTLEKETDFLLLIE